MAHVVQSLDAPSGYKDSQHRLDRQRQLDALSKSTTLYVGNLSFYTTEEQIYELFSRCASPEEGGGIKRIIMGLDPQHKQLRRTPCGFCFVEYYTNTEALACMRYVSGTKLDERIVRCDLDLGYADGRQFGRGKSGGQVRDEHRQDYDAGRGGWGAQVQAEKRREREELYADVGPGAPAGGGGEWKAADAAANPSPAKRARSPGDDDEDDRDRTRRRGDDD